MKWSNGKRYYGDWLNDKMMGKGVLIISQNERYEGGFKDGKFHGKGKYIFPNYQVYEGEWKKGKPHGKGKLTQPNGLVILTNYDNGIRLPLVLETMVLDGEDESLQ